MDDTGNVEQSSDSIHTQSNQHRESPSTAIRSISVTRLEKRDNDDDNEQIGTVLVSTVSAVSTSSVASTIIPLPQEGSSEESPELLKEGETANVEVERGTTAADPIEVDSDSRLYSDSASEVTPSRKRTLESCPLPSLWYVEPDTPVPRMVYERDDDLPVNPAPCDVRVNVTMERGGTVDQARSMEKSIWISDEEYRAEQNSSRSRVGAEYQATELPQPLAATLTTPSYGGEVLWDPVRAAQQAEIGELGM